MVWHYCLVQLTVDEGRSSASVPEGATIRITMVTLGADMPYSNSSRFSGCLAGMVINSEPVDLVSSLSNSRLINQHLQVSTNMAGSGCGQGSPCSEVQCPDNSRCEAGWRNYSCACGMPNRIINNQCVNPCSTEPCKNGGTCNVAQFSSAGFQCSCANGFQLPTCDNTINVKCGLGLYGPPSCSERCLCDPRGANQQVCDATTGDCSCKVMCVYDTNTLYNI